MESASQRQGDRQGDRETERGAAVSFKQVPWTGLYPHSPVPWTGLYPHPPVPWTGPYPLPRPLSSVCPPFPPPPIHHLCLCTASGGDWLEQPYLGHAVESACERALLGAYMESACEARDGQGPW